RFFLDSSFLLSFLPSSLCFFFYCYGHPLDLHSFPTRRSSDLFKFIGVFLARFFAYLGKRRANDVAAKVDAEADQVEHNEKLNKRVHFAFLLSRSHAVSSLWQKPTQGWPGR